MCLLCDFFWTMPQLMPMVCTQNCLTNSAPEGGVLFKWWGLWNMMNHPICNHGGVLFKCHNQSSIPSICVLVPAPEGANPPVQPNMELNVPSNDHSPRPATLGIHPSIEFCRHPITSKPLPSTQVWHGLQKSMLVKDMECS